ncbi:MAG: hypothetical protein OER87_09570 [Gammaproteobacteria bacterium]|nr:hypothetical protein [Gammaproteobacteria bacterium]
MALLTVAGFLGSCSTTSQMMVPADVSGALEVIAATDRSPWSGALADETFTLGPYQVTDVDRDWDNSNSGTVSVAEFNFSSGKTEGGYAYRFGTPGGWMSGHCLTEAKGNSFSLGGVDFQSRVAKLSCICNHSGTEVARVILQADITAGYSGTVTASHQQYRIESINEREGGFGSGDPTGYRVDGNQPIGAVEVLNPGRIWLARNLEDPQRARLACTFAGLMLYLPPTD